MQWAKGIFEQIATISASYPKVKKVGHSIVTWVKPCSKFKLYFVLLYNYIYIRFS